MNMGLGILNLNPNIRIRNTTAEIITDSMANASFLLKSICTRGVCPNLYIIIPLPFLTLTKTLSIIDEVNSGKPNRLLINFKPDSLSGNIKRFIKVYINALRLLT